MLTSISCYYSDPMEICCLSIQLINDNNLTKSIRQSVDGKYITGRNYGVVNSTQTAWILISSSDLQKWGN